MYKDGISDHLAVFFTTTSPVKNSCRVKRLKIRKHSKINKTEFMSDIANSELIQVPYKTATLLSHQYFHTLRNLLDKNAPVPERKTPQHANKGFINSKILAAKKFWEIRSRQHKVSGTLELCLTLISMSQTTCHKSLSPLEYKRQTSTEFFPFET